MIWLILWSLSGVLLWGNFFYSAIEADPNDVPSPFLRVFAFIMSMVMGPFTLIPNIVTMEIKNIKPRSGLKYW